MVCYDGFMADVEVLELGEFDPERQARDFDAVSLGRFYWMGRIAFDDSWEDGGRIVVYSDRSDPLGNDVAIKRGEPEHMIDEVNAKALISRAIISCFNHTTTKNI